MPNPYRIYICQLGEFYRRRDVQDKVILLKNLVWTTNWS